MPEFYRAGGVGYLLAVVDRSDKRRKPGRRDGMSWEQMRRASLAAERDDFRRTTPGERVERVLEMVRETGELAARGRNRFPREPGA